MLLSFTSAHQKILSLNSQITSHVLRVHYIQSSLLADSVGFADVRHLVCFAIRQQLQVNMTYSQTQAIMSTCF